MRNSIKFIYVANGSLATLLFILTFFVSFATQLTLLFIVAILFAVQMIVIAIQWAVEQLNKKPIAIIVDSNTLRPTPLKGESLTMSEYLNAKQND